MSEVSDHDPVPNHEREDHQQDDCDDLFANGDWLFVHDGPPLRAREWDAATGRWFISRAGALKMRACGH